jgi:regulator of nonsense transcripts 1
MPVPLGQFISRHVYNTKLESQHKLHDKSCLSFVDASNGEEIKAGFSWKVRTLHPSMSNLQKLTHAQNLQEIQTIVHLVRSYYKGKDFCIITPYDAQRAAIESQLKSEGLPWERVFNVDSFQGMSKISPIEKPRPTLF